MKDWLWAGLAAFIILGVIAFIIQTAGKAVGQTIEGNFIAKIDESKTEAIITWDVKHASDCNTEPDIGRGCRGAIKVPNKPGTTYTLHASSLFDTKDWCVRLGASTTEAPTDIPAC